MNPQQYVNDIATKYGINLRGSGKNIKLVFDDSLKPGIKGVTREIEGGRIIRVGPEALVDEATLANTIAHELSHARDFMRGHHKPHSVVYEAGDALEDYIRGGR